MKLRPFHQRKKNHQNRIILRKNISEQKLKVYLCRRTVYPPPLESWLKIHLNFVEKCLKNIYYPLPFRHSNKFVNSDFSLTHILINIISPCECLRSLFLLPFTTIISFSETQFLISGFSKKRATVSSNYKLSL